LNPKDEKQSKGSMTQPTTGTMGKKTQPMTGEMEMKSGPKPVGGEVVIEETKKPQGQQPKRGVQKISPQKKGVPQDLGVIKNREFFEF
jgi:hypothetical protein